MNSEKIVNRKVAIALGIVCLVLSVLLVGSLYPLSIQISSLTSQVESLEDENSSLKLEISAKYNAIGSLNSQIASLNSQIAELQNQKGKLQTWLKGNTTYYTSWVNSLNPQITALNESYM